MAPRGEITVRLLEGRIIECTARGHLVTEFVLSAQAEFDRIVATAPETGRFDSLFDGSEIESFAPGLPMQWVKWGAQRIDRTDRVAIVGRPGPMLSVATTFRYLLPTTRIALFSDRDPALEFLRDRTESR